MGPINEEAGLYAVVGGVLMLIAGVTGAATWARIGELAVEITGQESLEIVFQVLVLVGSLGGLIVILGGVLIHGKLAESVSGGKILITIGAGFGLIGLLIFLVVTMMGETPGVTIIAAMGLGLVGLVLSIVARQKAIK
ncbi:MAG: hypothetical protein KGY76_02810 [Candidatus Thermoplasmatota archaeon]|nr:hypothetical protein [Candidatus Thermoplasmatota archaeon]